MFQARILHQISASEENYARNILARLLEEYVLIVEYDAWFGAHVVRNSLCLSGTRVFTDLQFTWKLGYVGLVQSQCIICPSKSDLATSSTNRNIYGDITPVAGANKGKASHNRRAEILSSS